MAYSTGSATSMNDLMTQLSTFAVGLGWTQDQYTAEAGATDGKLSLHKGDCYVHFAWNSSKSPSIGVYQSLGYSGTGVGQWQHTGDSGNGPSSAPSTSSTWNSDYRRNRFVSTIGAGPYTSHFFFGDDSSVDYIHVVLEFAPFTYRHFGFGNLEKAWNWTGGEYCYGHTQATSDSSRQDCLLTSNGSNSTTVPESYPTIHAEGLPGQPGTSKWGTFAAHTSLSSTWNDRAGNLQVRFVGGAPGGAVGIAFNILPANSGDGFVPLAGVPIFYRDVTPNPDNLYLMGWMPDVRTLNMRNFNPKDEITVGADTWKIFPHVRKQNNGDLNESENLGVAYKKIP